MSKRKELAGQKFNRLTVLYFCPGIKGRWKCKCLCGNECLVTSSALITGHTKSCGCRSKECLQLRTKHGKSCTKSYHTYNRMIDRCYNKNCPRYSYYGGRGIRVCVEWLESFENFYRYMGDPPSARHSIDRIDNNGNYEPINCKWSTQSEQLSNRRPFKHNKLEL